LFAFDLHARQKRRQRMHTEIDHGLAVERRQQLRLAPFNPTRTRESGRVLCKRPP
jgi:hypothetical protein